MDPILIDRAQRLNRKIWEIDPSNKCALIGTCLSRLELRKLAHNTVYQIPKGLDDYQLHAQFIRISDTCSTAGKSLHKYLHKKYRLAAKAYDRCQDTKALAALWKEDLAQGKIDSAWWAVLIHPQATASFLAHCYGTLHMLSHDCTNRYHRTRQRISELRTKTDMLSEVLVSERQNFRKERKELKSLINDLKAELRSQLRVQQQVEDQKRQIKQLQQTVDERERLNDLRQENNSLFGRVDELTEELTGMGDKFKQLSEQLTQLEREKETMQSRDVEHSRVIAALERTLLNHMQQEENPCTHCESKNTSSCPGINLCGKTVLYVGGLHKMVPHYRQLVEQSGGNFLHHDGGKEASRNILPKMLGSADAVLCPVDCVSHDACSCVKKMCKRYHKPFVLMRSSGLSSLARGLDEIVQ
nr:DUF2325 domain-containing protein [uncultured Desulfobulbus sp.]